MSETEAQLKRIHNKLQLLLKQNIVLQKENSLLKEKLSIAEREAAEHESNLDGLKQQVDVLKYSNGEMSETDRKEFEKKINSYVKEIDRCITMLSQ